MAPTPEHTPSPQLSQTEFQTLLHEKMKLAIRFTLITVLKEEFIAVIGAGGYDRGPGHQDQPNGYYARDLLTTVGQIADLPIPRTHRRHQTQLFKRCQRRQAELDSAIGTMFAASAS